LRAAIAAASSGDTIVFDPSLASETITLASGPLALGSNLTINGLGAKLLTISGNNATSRRAKREKIVRLGERSSRTVLGSGTTNIS
jgi:hypothetical protein